MARQAGNELSVGSIPAAGSEKTRRRQGFGGQGRRKILWHQKENKE